MSKKKRVFDIDFEDADLTEDVPAGTEARRGPMAAAITENAEALSARQQAEAAIRQENDALAHEHVRLKKAGLITDLVPLELIRTDKLTRDRAEGRDAEIDELKRSIKDIGLSNPIRVEVVGDAYELIQGYRRLTAFRELFEETGEARFARIPAGINAKGEDLLRLYRRMVDENLVRRGVAFGEMAQLAVQYRNEDPNMKNYDQAVEVLYSSAARQKRAYIKQFVRLIVAADGALRHVPAVSRALGLAVVKRLDEDVNGIAIGLLRRTLRQRDDRTEEEELALLSDFAKGKGKMSRKAAKAPVARQAKTTFRLARPEGDAKCTVADGRIELRLEKDFSGVERGKLEAAVAAFLAALER
ncbi:ParB N-terminal domain-containing protein [uncultured Sulfitobacter sp.]|uniref:ParB N-terminal domain-containing protein n=1 Tax=uncultured Sulfitobacter sp. TaxID=191468 RepID=UPI002619A080|nr:ParB N-terminal domain-containing protein [uncultured Sulfitobacter sp.]